jgi:hypothetical protein
MKNHQNSLSSEIGSLKSSKQKLKPNDKMKLLNLLTVILPMQNRYGTTEKEIEAIIEGWARALGEFDIKSIVDATWAYIRIRPDIPAPAKIINIIRFGHPDGEKTHTGMRIPTQSEIL